MAVNHEKILAGISSSAKYTDVHPETVARLIHWAEARYPRTKEITKAVKKKLHQIYGLYVGSDFAKRSEEALRRMKQAAIDEREKAALDLMRLHTSTDERLPYLDSFYQRLFEITGKPKVIADLACGLQPAAYPFMGLQSDIRYYAYDIDCRMIEVINEVFALYGIPRLARCVDLFTLELEETPDILLLLKTLPCIEQQEKAFSRALLTRFEAKHIVVSFPSKTVGGREVGMQQYYQQSFLELTASLGRMTQHLEFPNEDVYLIG